MAKFVHVLPLLFVVLAPNFIGAEPACSCGELCPTGWTQWGGHCYLKITDRTWQEAIEECHQLESFMATPHSKEENDFLFGMHKHFWINCMDIYKEGEWDCCDGEKTDFTNWDKGEPNNDHDEDCAVVQTSGKWNDLDCKEKAKSFCKKPVECLH